MEKKTYVKRYPRDRREFRDERPHGRGDKKEFREERPNEKTERRERHGQIERDDLRRPQRSERPGRAENPRMYQKHFRRPKRIQKTKMFTSKKDLVEYVNSIGDEGHKIDVYKIEDELYKVVIIEQVHSSKSEHVEVEIDQDITDELDVEDEEK